MIKLNSILEDIKEKYAAYITRRWGDGEYPVFVNPEFKEIQEAVSDDGYIRYITTLNGEHFGKEVYIWNANMGMHTEVAKNIFVELEDLFGVAKLEGRELLIGAKILPDFMSDLRISKEDLRDILEGRYDWLEDYYFNIEKVKEVYNKEDLKRGRL